MRLTVCLRRVNQGRQIKQLWKRHGIYKVPEYVAPSVLKDKEVIEATDLFKREPPERWTPPVDDIRFAPLPPETEHRKYHDEPIYVLQSKKQFSEGTDQACILAKAQKFQGFPEPVKKLIGTVSIENQDELVQRIIMRSQVWNNTKEKLPKRIDKENLNWVFRREFGIPKVKQTEILLTGLVQLAERIGARQWPSTVSSHRLIHKPALETHYTYKGSTVNINNIGESLVTGQTGLPPFGDQQLIDMSQDHTLPDMFPISPTIDFEKTQIYEIKSSAVWKSGREPRFSVPQTLYRINNNFWQDDRRQAYAMMVALGYAVTVARAKYGDDVTVLPEPATVKAVHMDETSVNFLFFQLNTMDFSSTDGIKNFVWLDSSNVLFKRHLSKPWKGKEEEFNTTAFDTYEPDVFKKFLAAHLYGVPETLKL